MSRSFQRERHLSESCCKIGDDEKVNRERDGFMMEPSRTRLEEEELELLSNLLEKMLRYRQRKESR